MILDSGDGDSLQDDRGEGASTATIVDNDVTLPFSWLPPANLVSTFDSLVCINATRGAKPSVSDLLQGPLFAVGPLRIPAFALSDAIHVSTCPSTSSRKTISLSATSLFLRWELLTLLLIL